MSILFQPLTIGAVTVKNRFVRSATQDWLGNEDGTISERTIALYRLLAQHDVGLIITAHAYIQHPLGRGSIRQNGIYEDRFMEGYKQLVDVVHSYATKLIVQISHAGRQSSPELTEGLTPIAPSAVTDGSTGITPTAMTEEQIEAMIDDFVAAIGRVRQTGADGVQLHIAHGYALAQFFSPYTNQRTDGWGGSIEARTRILSEIAKRSHHYFDDKFLLIVKLNSTDGFDGPGYLSLDDVLYTARLLESLGVAAIEVSGGMREAKGVMAQSQIATPQQEAYFAKAAQAIKQAVSIPVILVGGLRSQTVMEQVIQDGIADMVALSRPFVKQPDLVKRLQEGAKKVSCISCNACFKPNSLICYVANEQPIELRGFGKLSTVFKERGWPFPREVKLPGALTGYSLLRMLGLDEYPIEVVFINGKAHFLEDVIRPGDRVSLVPPGTPGPYRVLLGFVDKK